MANTAYNNGQYAESPQVQGKVQYEHDFWGKAAYYGKPIPFTATVVAGWQRNVKRQATAPALSTLGNNTTVLASVTENSLHCASYLTSRTSISTPGC